MIGYPMRAAGQRRRPPQPAPSPAPTPAAGLIPMLDISSNNADLFGLISTLQPAILLVRAYLSIEDVSQDWTRNAIALGLQFQLPIAYYWWPYADIDGAWAANEATGLVTSCCMPAWGMQDVEQYTDGSTPAGPEIAAGISALRAALIRPVIYSSVSQWALVPNPCDLTHVDELVADYNGNADLNVAPFGNGCVFGHQWTSTPADLSVIAA